MADVVGAEPQLEEVDGARLWEEELANLGNVEDVHLALMAAGKRGSPGQLGGRCVRRKTKRSGVRLVCANKVSVTDRNMRSWRCGRMAS